MNKTFAIQAITAAFLISAQPAAFCQENLAPEDITKPAPKPPSGAASGRNHRTVNQDIIVTPETAPGFGGGGVSISKRADKFSYISKREDVAPVVVEFSDKTEN